MLIHNYDSNLDKSVLDHIYDEELESSILRYGSLISIISGKPVSVVYVFNYLLNNTLHREFLCKLADSEWVEVVNYFSKRYPILSKSKKIQQEELEFD